MTTISYQRSALYTGLALIGLAVLLSVSKGILPDGLIRPPTWMIFGFADWINSLFAFMRDDMGLFYVIRGVARGVQWCLDVSANLLYGKNRWPHIGPLPWSFIAVSAFMLGYSLKNWRLGFFSAAVFVWIVLLGQWRWAMETLSVIVIATPFAVFFGLIIGVLAWTRPGIERYLNPILNIAQSLPHFSYMIPVVVFIGVGAKAGAIVTIIFATPPMIRMTLLGLKRVPKEVIESAQLCGATAWQVLRHACIPTARSDILVGVNQVIMQCLAMVVLASFIGMPGLGQKLLQLLQALKIGRSIEIGITIVLLAIFLDRCSRAWAESQPVHREIGTVWWVRHKKLVLWMGLSALTFLFAFFWDGAQEINRRNTITFSKILDQGVDQVVAMLDPITYALRAFLINYIFVPLREAYLWLPFSSVLALVAAVAWMIGKKRSTWICVGFVILIAMSSWWDRAMITAYMVTIAVMLAMIIGIPLGIWAGTNTKRASLTLLICDTAQTFPSFIYLIPVIMLFGVNDVSAISAVVIYGIVPMTRYTIEGIRGVPKPLIESAEMSGANKWQKLWYVQLPMAVPVMVIGLNQTVMFSLFMVIIAAFIGTQDLGQEMQRALSATDVGKGLVLGLCVAFMGLLVDHLLLRWAHARKQALNV